MRTTKAIATISFNSKDYLVLKLKELTKSGFISFWAFVEHLPEDDEGGTKNHIHLYIEPSKMLQSDDIRNQLKEFDPLKPDKPLGCLVFNSSKFDHWYMYSKHDKSYLASKGQSRKYQYKHEAFITSDDDDILFKAKSIDLISLSPYRDMEEAIRNGFSFSQYFRRGGIPIQQVKLWESAWQLLITDKVERNGYENHTNYDEYGEIIE